VTLARAGQLIADATLRGRAVPAFNVLSLEQAEGVVEGAQDAAVPVLLQISQNAIRYHGGFGPLLAACRELAEVARVPVGLHVDHLEDGELALAVIDRAEELGVGSLMFDAASLPDDENVAVTREIADAAHRRGLWVEGELGEVGGKNGAHTPGVRTDPEEAAAFAAATGIDALAVAVGSEHAMLDRSAELDLSLIARLAARVPVPLVLHGSSGVSDDLLAAAVASGMRKINIGTALAVAATTRLRRELALQPDVVDPRTYSRGPRDEVRAVVAHLATLVG
jgi:fructose-bisphosphate aldolase class II